MAQQMAQGVPVPTYTGVGDTESYMERLECYCDLMKTPEESKVALLLCGLTAGQYETLRDLVSPEVLKTVEFKVLKEKLMEHYGSVRNTRLERTKFRAVKREENESMAAFEAIQLANTFLLFEDSARGGKVDTPPIEQQSGISNVKSEVECYRCGGKGHRSSDKVCKVLGKKCNNCGVLGHFAKSKFCKGRELKSHAVRGRGRARRSGGIQHQITEESADKDKVARERDMEYKLKMKDYADKKAADSNIQEGDIVLMRNETKGKLQPNFRPEKYKVINLNGLDMIVQSKENGSTVRRNVQFAKKVQVAEPDTEVEVSEPEPETEHTGPDKVTMATETSAPEVRRSVRVRKPPVKFADYLVNH
ncbi:predicted protein [Nematostella vectensis]|uniref:CCHC-type domain-containing protein n=1 Tax=Nematostella vectensis TaxID=45351 RepID=A7S6F8_NEMVE|nr:predicted protein [Nematostella vectensis]|eukprot:XP_001632775.1 predicted protein [Nematostella vectensis]